MTTIILNTDAVNALFPEGSEARVQLQRCVLRNLAEQLVKNPDSLAHLRTQLDVEINAIKDAVLKELGFEKSWTGKVTLSDAHKTALRDQLRDQATSVVSAVVKERVDGLRSQVESMIELQGNRMVRDALRDQVSGLVSSLGTAAKQVL